jgi:UDP-N-acetylmuramoyl-L-alanyl-D-glutamate--2,6-diaminopimelate ligase
MMTLHEWLAPWLDIDSNLEVMGLSLNSHEMTEGDVFIALNGAKQHGLAYASQAIDNGAVAILFDSQDAHIAEMYFDMSETVAIAIPDLLQNLGEMAARFYQYPSQAMTVIGITGTNGKTSCSQFLSQMLAHCAFIGTLGWGTPSQLNKTLNTTPDALTVQKILATLKKTHSQFVAMEVSSHGLAQGRVNGVQFNGAIFTNLSRDHLDYHGTMDAYLETKLQLFRTKNLHFAVINLDDAMSQKVIDVIAPDVTIIGVSTLGKKSPRGETVSASNVQLNLSGIECDIRWQDQMQTLPIPLIGRFNLENVLCVLAAMLALDIQFSVAAQKLSTLTSVDGRMTRLGGENNQPLVIIDYAHTPDALEKVLKSLRQHTQGSLSVVFGCGGNRDSGKRPQMGRIAEQYADHVYLTDDNPRFESNEEIMQAILSGCLLQKHQIIHHRAQAIKEAILRASAQDCILIAGKGHESYQEIEGVQYPFNDTQCVREVLATL